MTDQSYIQQLPERASVSVRAQTLYELSLKFREIARPNRLPDASHGVKEERQIVMRQKNAAKHLAGKIEMAQKRA